jgi:hypothetical protein
MAAMNDPRYSFAVRTGRTTVANFVTILHECKDYQAWRRVYDADAPRRKTAGLTELICARDLDQPNLVGLMFEAGDFARARAMLTSPGLAATMSAAGVVGQPRIMYRYGEYAHVAAAGYATISAIVRNFDTAMDAYAMDADDRKAAGLTDLAVLQAKDDPNNILLLWSVQDVARATAFFESPQLAAHMVNTAGVMVAPERHFWRV